MEKPKFINSNIPRYLMNEKFCHIGEERKKELETLLREHGFEFSEQSGRHVLPNPLPVDHPTERPEDNDPNHMGWRGNDLPLPIGYLETDGDFYITNTDMPQFAEIQAGLRGCIRTYFLKD